MSEKFFGKYRGSVVNNVDPLQTGRLLVQVPGIAGQPALWAVPCVPSTLPKAVGSALPEVGAGVWIEFEQGDPKLPIWTGCWYGNSAQTPPSLKNSA